MRCPACGHKIDEPVKCGECGTRLNESEAARVGSKILCTMCLAAAVGRKHREAECPRMPDPETEPREWERAWRAHERRQPS